mgnify:CR=1 FL=1
MTLIETISLLASMASLILAVVAIYLALYHKKQSDSVADTMRDVLTEIKTDSKAISKYAESELKDWGKWARSGGIFQKYNPVEKHEEVSVFRQSESIAAATPATASVSIGELDAIEQLSLEIAAGSSFTNKQRDEILSLLRRYRGDRKDLIFQASLERVIDAFAGADLTRYLDYLADQYADVIHENRGILQTFVTSYGMRILGTENPDSQDVMRFERFVAACKTNDIREYSMPVELVWAHSQGDKAKVGELLEIMKEMDPLKQIAVVELIKRGTDPTKVARTPTPEVLMNSQKYSRFVDEYGDLV